MVYAIKSDFGLSRFMQLNPISDFIAWAIASGFRFVIAPGSLIGALVVGAFVDSRSLYDYIYIYILYVSSHFISYTYTYNYIYIYIYIYTYIISKQSFYYIYVFVCIYIHIYLLFYTLLYLNTYITLYPCTRGARSRWSGGACARPSLGTLLDAPVPEYGFDDNIY